MSVNEDQDKIVEVSQADGLSEISLRADHVTVVVVPESGGKILRLIDNDSGFNLLWENPRVPVARTYAGAPFDDVWCGGWDDVFPTDPACDVDGSAYHDHGDLWIAPWAWDVVRDDGGVGVLHLSRESVSLPCRAEKWISVRRDGNSASVRLRLTNHGSRPFSFMWNQHIAHAVGDDSRVHVPASRMGVVGDPPSLEHDGTVAWPVHAGRDLSRLGPPDSGRLEFLFALDLREGWCVVTHPSRSLAVRITFDKDVFQTPWQWRVLGGWRGHHVLLTEPCTSLPGSLAQSIENGSAAILEAGASIETEVNVTIASEFDRDAAGDEDPIT